MKRRTAVTRVAATADTSFHNTSDRSGCYHRIELINQHQKCIVRAFVITNQTYYARKKKKKCTIAAAHSVYVVGLAGDQTHGDNECCDILLLAPSACLRPIVGSPVVGLGTKRSIASLLRQAPMLLHITVFEASEHNHLGNAGVLRKKCS